MIIASFQFGDLGHHAIQASHGIAYNIGGWIWADPIGWTSMNSDNPGACATPPCGTYGLQLDVTTRKIKGFAWNDAAGWICFGESCSAVPTACSSTPPTGIPSDMKAAIDSGTGVVAIHGWANVCNQGDKGWISLNCEDPAGSVICTGYPYRVRYNTTTGNFSASPGASYGWNGNLDGTGFGYVDFKNMYTLVNESTAAGHCSDGIDNDLNGKIDCADPKCSTASNCREDTIANCTDGIDNNLNGLKDCEEAACRALLGGKLCEEKKGNIYFLDICHNGLDDNGDGKTDCDDLQCVADPACVVSGEAACAPLDKSGRPGTPENCCSDDWDNDSNGLKDCADSSCVSVPICLPVFISLKHGDVFAKAGITSIGSTTTSKATYLLTSAGDIVGFSSVTGRPIERFTDASQIPTLPTETSSGSGKYVGTLGILDVIGIRSPSISIGAVGQSGKYGIIQDLAPDPVTGKYKLPAVLEGKVYRIILKPSDPAHLAGQTFKNGGKQNNGKAITQRGNGILIVEGDLKIDGNLQYASQELPTSIRNLSSLGIIIKKRSDGSGGNLFIAPNVSKLVGAYFVENTIYTGTAGAVDPIRLEVYGLMAARQFKLERKYRSKMYAAETFVFDGRAVANPPPGMSEIGKALPTSKDAF